MSWVVFQEHEYFGTKIISIEETKEKAINKILELIKEQSLLLKDNREEWEEAMLKKMKISENRITTTLGFCSQNLV